MSGEEEREEVREESAGGEDRDGLQVTASYRSSQSRVDAEGGGRTSTFLERRIDRRR